MTESSGSPKIDLTVYEKVCKHHFEAAAQERKELKASLSETNAKLSEVREVLFNGLRSDMDESKRDIEGMRKELKSVEKHVNTKLWVLITTSGLAITLWVMELLLRLT
jgi:predicted nuclease with TOPRIM domain